LLLGFAPRQRSTRSVADSDQQGGHVFAMLVRFLKRWAGTVGSDAFATQSNDDFVGSGIGTFYLTGGVRFVDGHALDDLAFLVVEAPQEGAGA
jgi:hypothetical protein